jgi:hypothetical protein
LLQSSAALASCRYGLECSSAAKLIRQNIER